MLPFKTILFATDFSPPSKMAFGVASALARDYQARMIVLHVIEPDTSAYAEFGAYDGAKDDERVAKEQLHALTSPAPNVAVEHRMREGAPASVIVDAATETGADLIVMGTKGRTGLSRLVMGSVAEEVLRRSPCPVLTVRGVIPVAVTDPDLEPAVAIA